MPWSSVPQIKSNDGVLGGQQIPLASARPRRSRESIGGSSPGARQWVYNTTIVYTYALTTSQSAWAWIKDLGWRRIATGAPDGVSNVFGVACEAQASGKPVHVYIDDTMLYNMWLP